MKIYIPKTVIGYAWFGWYMVALDRINFIEQEVTFWIRLPFLLIGLCSVWLVIKAIKDDIDWLTGDRETGDG